MTELCIETPDQVTELERGIVASAIEQLTQTWTYLVALAATRKLLALHTDARGFNLAPGANASQALDIMSVEKDLVGSETFAVVDHRNNKKLVHDIDKLASHNTKHRYVFFSSPKYPEFERRHELEKSSKDIQVWSVDFKKLLAV